MFIYYMNNDPLDFNVACTKTYETSIIWNNVVLACMLTTLIPRKQVVSPRTRRLRNKRDSAIHAEYSERYTQDHITVPRVHPDRIGSQRQERSCGVLRHSVECIASAASAVRCFVTVRLQRQVKYSSSSVELRHVSSARGGTAGPNPREETKRKRGWATYPRKSGATMLQCFYNAYPPGSRTFLKINVFLFRSTLR